MQALAVAVLGPTVLALRLTSVALGTLGVPVAYVVVRRIWRRPTPALIAAALVTTSLWHVALSRIGVRSVAIPLAAAPALGLFWLACHRRRARRVYAAAGLFVGLGAYVVPSNLFVPLVMAAFTLYLVSTDRRQARERVGGLLVAGVVAVVVCLPLGAYFIEHRDQVLEHPERVSVLNPERPDESPWGAVRRNAVGVARAFVVAGDRSPVVNLPGRPTFDPFVAPFFARGSPCSYGTWSGPATGVPRASRRFWCCCRWSS